jgi:hypothetical protein
MSVSCMRKAKLFAHKRQLAVASNYLQNIVGLIVGDPLQGRLTQLYPLHLVFSCGNLRLITMPPLDLRYFYLLYTTRFSACKIAHLILNNNQTNILSR